MSVVRGRPIAACSSGRGARRGAAWHGSSAQIGLFVAPVLVIPSFAFGPAATALVFNGYETAALILAGLISTTLIADGESTWFEGVQLLAVYVLLGLVFYYA